MKSSPPIFSYLGLPMNQTEWLRVEGHEPDPKKEKIWLGPFSKLNVFLGANNSGKSRTLRHLFKQQVKSGHVLGGVERYFDATWENDTPRMNAARSSIGTLRGALSSSGMRDVVERIEHIAERLKFSEAPDRWKLMPQVSDLLAQAETMVSTQSEFRRGVYREGLARTLLPFGVASIRSGDTPFVYVPVLRSLRGFNRGWNAEDVLGQATKTQYFAEIHNDSSGRLLHAPWDLITGQDFYQRIRRHMLGPLNERRMISRFERYLSEHFFERQPVALIPRELGAEGDEGHTLYIKIGDELEQPIYRQGDGISQIIIMLYPIFAHLDKNLMLFIEEPENYLHPGFQRLLIDALLNIQCEDGCRRQVFVASHSHQFLDLTLESDEVSVFHFKKSLPDGDHPEKQPVVVMKPRSNASMPLLRELGVRNSSVLLANCTIWVEGPTDRMYFRHYMNLYQTHLIAEAKASTKPPCKPFLEDIHFTFAEYAGSNIEHWAFEDGGAEKDANKIRVERLCGTAFVIADRDSVKEKKSTDNAELGKKALRLALLQQKLGDRFAVLDVREVENLLSARALSETILAWEADSKDKPTLKPFTEKDYKDEYLGGFIYDKVLPRDFTPRKQFAKDKAGPILHKGEFAAVAIQQLKKWDEVSESAQSLTKRMWEFVASHNSR